MNKILNHRIKKDTHSPILLDVFYEETDIKKPIVVFCHGFKSYKDWGAYNQMAEYFAKIGFVFLKFNFSHNGGTMTNPIDFPDLKKFSENTFSKEQQDIQAVLNFIDRNEMIPHKEKNTKEIYLMGHSRGGAAVIIKSLYENRIKKVATLGAVIDLASRFPNEKEVLEQWKTNGVVYIPNLRTNQQMPLGYTLYSDFIKNQDKLDILKNADKLTIPQLIIHGNQDETVSVDDAFLMKKLNPKAELILLDTNHTFDLVQPWEKDHMPDAFLSSLDKIIAFFNQNH
jgi:pimeloyl-ACP methyl ester carboxylesterase